VKFEEIPDKDGGNDPIGITLTFDNSEVPCPKDI
jgi:hypothetical protein